MCSLPAAVVLIPKLSFTADQHTTSESFWPPLQLSPSVEEFFYFSSNFKCVFFLLPWCSMQLRCWILWSAPFQWCWWQQRLQSRPPRGRETPVCTATLGTSTMQRWRPSTLTSKPLSSITRLEACLFHVAHVPLSAVTCSWHLRMLELPDFNLKVAGSSFYCLWYDLLHIMYNSRSCWESNIVFWSSPIPRPSVRYAHARGLANGLGMRLVLI